MASIINEATQKSIARKLRIDPILLGIHLDAYADYVTTQSVADVAVLLTRWADNNLDTDFTRVEAKDKNFGVSDDPEDLREAIREELASILILHRAKWYESSGSMEVMMERG